MNNKFVDPDAFKKEIHKRKIMAEIYERLSNRAFREGDCSKGWELLGHARRQRKLLKKVLEEFDYVKSQSTDF